MDNCVGIGGSRDELFGGIVHKSENLYDLLLQAPVAICTLAGREHVYEFANPLYRQLIGGRSVVGLSIREAHPELEGQGVIELMDEVFRSGKPYRGKEFPVRTRTPEGRLRDGLYNFTFQPWHDMSGEIHGIVVVASEVTEQVRAREAVEQAVRARDEFLSIASHELKTPVTCLKLQLQLAKHRSGGEESQRFLQMINACSKQVDRLTDMIDTLLDVTRIQSGRVEYSFQEFSVAELVDDVLGRFSGQLEQARSFVVAEVAPLRVHWDRFRMEQVLANLIGNAIKYAPGKQIQIKAERVGENAILSVKDSGPGIPKEQQERIFDRFERACDSQGVTGLGLGLYIVKQIILGHDGTIRLESEPGNGANFVAELPFRPGKKFLPHVC